MLDEHEASRTAARPPDQNTKGGRLLDRFSWANFTCTQSTGGVAMLLAETPHRFRGLQTAGVVVFILNLVLFGLFTTAMICRFIQTPSSLRRSLTKPPEAYFTGSLWLSIATIIMCTQRFAAPHTGPWLVVAIRILFWAYAAITLTYNILIFVAMFVTCPLAPGSLSPPMFLMVYNAMLSGTVASAIAPAQPPSHRLPILVAGVAYQGLGWLLCLLLLPLFLSSLLIHGLGPASQRPGLFIAVGSSGYTVVALIGCARAVPADHAYFAKHPTASETLSVLALWVGVFLWLFTFWLFAIALVAHVPILIPRFHTGSWAGATAQAQAQVQAQGQGPGEMSFTLPWWALVFPNVGFTIATIYIGEELESNAIAWVASVMTVLVFGAWLMDMVLHFKAVVRGRVM